MTSFYVLSTVVSVWAVRQALSFVEEGGLAVASIVREGGEAVVRILLALEEGTLDVVLETQRCIIVIVRLAALGVVAGVVWASVWMLLRRSSASWSGRFDAKTELRASGQEPEANVDRRTGGRGTAAVLGKAFESRSLVEVEPSSLDWVGQLDLKAVAAPGSWGRGQELYHEGHVELQWPEKGTRVFGTVQSSDFRREYTVSLQPEEPRFKCSCPDRRGSRSGKTCKHGIALALAVVDRAAEERAAAVASSSRRGRSSGPSGGSREEAGGPARAAATRGGSTGRSGRPGAASAKHLAIVDSVVDSKPHEPEESPRTGGCWDWAVWKTEARRIAEAASGSRAREVAAPTEGSFLPRRPAPVPEEAAGSPEGVNPEALARVVKEGLQKLLQEPSFQDSEAGKEIALLAAQLSRTTLEDRRESGVRIMGGAATQEHALGLLRRAGELGEQSCRKLLVFLTAFTLDREDIGDALVALRKLGATVQVLVDERNTLAGQTQGQLPLVRRLAAWGVEVRTCKGESAAPHLVAAGRAPHGYLGAQHSKTMMVCYDKEHAEEGTFIVGSTNWTTSSRSNREVSACMSLSGGEFLQAREALAELWDLGVPLTVGGADAAAAAKERRSRSASRGPATSATREYTAGT